MSQRCLTLALALLATTTCFAPDAPIAKAKVDSLDWLAGTWEMQASGRTVTEQWMPPAGGTMPGMSRTVAGGRTVEYEFLLLRDDADGGLSYVAKPSRQPEATFKLTKATNTELVFDNPAHDFPQRILYTLQSATNLVAAIEGTKNGKARRVEFNYTRARGSR